MKNILITGAGSGFGLLATRTLASAGHHVIVTMRKTRSRNAAIVRELKSWAKSNGYKITVAEMDVTSNRSVHRSMAKIKAATQGKIDVLFNNAGAGLRGVMESTSTSQVEELFRVNFFGSDRLIKAVIPFMRPNKSGLIVQVSSVLSRLHLPLLGAYCSSKSAVDTLAETYHYELKSFGIDVAIIQPGAYPTEIKSKTVPPDRPEIKELYTNYLEEVAKGFQTAFPTSDMHKNPQEVVDLLKQIIDLPNGQRKLWYPIGTGAAEELVKSLNSQSQMLTKHAMGG